MVKEGLNAILGADDILLTNIQLELSVAACG